MSASQELPRIRKPLYYVIATGSEQPVPSATFGNSMLGKAATASNFFEARDKANEARDKGKLKAASGRPMLGVLNNEDALVVVYGPPIGPTSQPTGQPGGKRRRGFKKSRKGRKTRKNKSRRLRRH
jgi:hypothetical protein